MLEEKDIDVVFILFVGDEILFNKSLYGRYYTSTRNEPCKYKKTQKNHLPPTKIKKYLAVSVFFAIFDFYVTGIFDKSKKEQFANFNRQLNNYSNSYYPIVDNWFDAFHNDSPVWHS